MKKIESIIISQTNNGIFHSEFEKEVYNQKGGGATIKEAVEDLFYHIEANEKETEEERQKLFIQRNLPQAKEMAVELFNITGPDSFDLRKFINKSKMAREEAKLKLNFLASFGLVYKDNDKKTYQIVIDSDSLKQYYFNESEKWLATSKYYKGLADELSNIDRKIQEEKDKTQDNNDDNT